MFWAAVQVTWQCYDKSWCYTQDTLRQGRDSESCCRREEVVWYIRTINFENHFLSSSSCCCLGRCRCWPGLAAKNQDHLCRLLWSPAEKISRVLSTARWCLAFQVTGESSMSELAIASSKLSLKPDSNFFRFKGPLWLMVEGSCVVDQLLFKLTSRFKKRIIE